MNKPSNITMVSGTRVSGTSNSKLFLARIKEFKNIRMRSDAKVYFSLKKSDIRRILKYHDLVIRYTYLEGYTDTLWIEKITNR